MYCMLVHFVRSLILEFKSTNVTRRRWFFFSFFSCICLILHSYLFLECKLANIILPLAYLRNIQNDTDSLLARFMNNSTSHGMLNRLNNSNYFNTSFVWASANKRQGAMNHINYKARTQLEGYCKELSYFVAE